MATNVEVTKTGGENTASILRKFTRRMQGIGIVQHMRKRRYRVRPLSTAANKRQALRRIKKQEQYEQLLKEGKVSEKPVRGQRR